MKTKTKRVKPWNLLTQQERKARVHSLIGKYPGSGHGVEDFLREKHYEIEREELRYRKSHPKQ